jgi:hypothetical protein
MTVSVGQLAVKYPSAAADPKPWMIHVEREVLEDTSLSGGARLVYAILRGYQGRKCNEPFPSLPTLSRKVGRVRKIIQKHLTELEAAGLIERVTRRESGKFCSNGYRILGRSPKGKNVTTVNSSPKGKNTEGQKHRSEENGRAESALLRNPIYKESHSLKESHKEREEPLGKKDAKALYRDDPRFAHKDVDGSLSRMFKEHKLQFPSAIEVWLGRERNPRKPLRSTPAPEYNEGADDKEYMTPGSPEAAAEWEKIRGTLFIKPGEEPTS